MDLRLSLARLTSIRAVYGLGRRRALLGDRAGAIAAFRIVNDSGEPDFRTWAALHLWVLYAESDDLRRSLDAYRDAVRLAAEKEDGFMGEGSVEVGSMLGGDYHMLPAAGAARAAYLSTIEARDSEVSSMAAIGLGMMLWGILGAPKETRAAFQRAIDAGHPEYAPTAARWLGVFCIRSGDPDRAREPLRFAIESGHAKQSPAAAMYLDDLQR